MKELLIKYKSVIMYLIFGVLTTIVNVFTYYICYDVFKIYNVSSTIIAWVVAVSFAYLTNKPFVFESKSWAPNVVVDEVVKFLGCRIGTGVIEVGFMYVCVDLSGWNGTVMKLVINVIVVVLNYVASKMVIFGGSQKFE